MSDKSNGFASDLANWARGLCMGAADIVPGVSGGTIALILGHYQRLVTAISHFDGNLVQLMRRREFREAFAYVDFRFLIGLAAGIGSGVLALASLMHYLLENQLPYTYAVFCGLILVSCYTVARQITRWNWLNATWLVLGALFAWQIAVVTPQHIELTPLSAFLSATVAICAMILPGISGAFVLLLLGVYHPVTDLIKGLPKGEVTLDGLVLIIAFGGGCLVGLLAFSRLLRWLLANRHDTTFACLVGLMLGSLYKLWPFQQPTSDTAHLEFKNRVFEHLSPADSQVNALLVILLAVTGVLVTLGVDQFVNRSESIDESA